MSLDDVKRRCDRAAPGPWPDRYKPPLGDVADVDREFIYAARTDIPWLLELLEAYRRVAAWAVVAMVAAFVLGFGCCLWWEGPTWK